MSRSTLISARWRSHNSATIFIISIIALLMAALSPIMVAGATTTSPPVTAADIPATAVTQSMLNAVPKNVDNDKLFVEGKNFVNCTGTPQVCRYWVPVGVDAGTDNSFDNGGNAKGHSDGALNWKMTAIRLNVYCTNDKDYSERYMHGYIALLDSITAIVDEYTAKRMAVIVECQDPWEDILSPKTAGLIAKPGTPPANDPGSDLGKDNYQQYFQLVRDLGILYKTDPYFMFDFHNESYGPFTATLRDALVVLRSTGAQNIAIGEALNAGNDAGSNAPRLYTIAPPVAAGECNVAFSYHFYGWAPAGESIATAIAQDFQKMASLGLAVFVGEMGYTDNGSGSYAANKAAADAVFQLAPQYNIGALVWNGTFASDHYNVGVGGLPFYDVDQADSARTPLGQQLWNFTTTQPVQPLYTGPLGASHCLGTVSTAPSAVVSAALKAASSKYASELGAAMANPTPVGSSWIQQYVGGTVVWSPLYGAHVITEPLSDQVVGNNMETMADEWVEYDGASATAVPTSNPMPTYLEHGSYVLLSGKQMLVETPATGAHFVTAPVLAAWQAQGGGKSFLGYPTSDASSTGVTSFEGGSITVNPTTGVVTVSHS